MMFPIVGSIRNTVKLAELDSKWQQRKSKIGKEPVSEMDMQIRMFKEDLKRMKENEKVGAIDAKLKSGQGLTPEEIEYLQKKHPEKYKAYLEIKNEKESYNRQLKTCKTKEDVERLKINKLNGYLTELKFVKGNPNISKATKKAIMEKILMKAMGIQDVHMKFVRSARYKALPTDEERAEEIKDRNESANEKMDGEKVKEDNAEAEGIEEEPVKPQDSEQGDGIEEKEPVKLQELITKADVKFEEVKNTWSKYVGASLTYDSQNKKIAVKK